MIDPGKTTAIILAAGHSSRMGEFKPLLPLAEMTVLEKTVRLFQRAGIQDIRVVVGYRATDLAPLLEQWKIRWVVNACYKRGMFSSILAGVNTLEMDREAFFLLPVDIPLVRPQTILDLLAAYQKDKENILYPVFGDRRGHPPLIAASYAKEIKEWSGEGGLRCFLEQYERYALDVEVADEYILLDMDTPADYQRLLIRHMRYDIPTAQECWVLMTKRFAVEKKIRHHCQAVARLALKLGRVLEAAGHQMDLDLILAAGLLHDLAREKPNHAAVGAQILREMGYFAVADVVENHMDITIHDEDPIHPSEIVYLADKLVRGNRSVFLNNRFAEKLSKYANDAQASAVIKLRLRNALKIKQRIEAKVGRSMEAVLSEISLKLQETNANDLSP
jgi:putative nucleotidyltransferase with HDIG domain